MPSPDLGRKRACPDCSAKFYDLDQDPTACPECGRTHPQSRFLKPRRTRGAPIVRAAPPPKVKQDSEAISDPIDIEDGIGQEDSMGDDGELENEDGSRRRPLSDEDEDSD